MAKYSLTPSDKGKGAAAEKPKEKGFFGVKIPFLNKKLGVTTSKKNPLTQVEDLVTGLPANIVRLGIGGVKELDKVGRGKVDVGDVLKKETREKELPILNAIGTSAANTARTLNPQDLVDVAKGDVKNTALAKRIEKEGVLGTGLATVSDVAMVAGGVGLLGKAAGAGSLAKAANLERAAGATSKAAGLGKKATAAQLDEAATKAAAKGIVTDAVDLQKASIQLDEAAKLRATKTTLPAKITEQAQNVSRLGNELGNIPAKPYQLIGKAAGKIPQGIGTAVEAATERGLPGAGRAEKMVSGVANVVKYAGDKAKVADLYYKNVTAPTVEALYRRLERGEGVDAIRANLIGRFPGSEPVFTKMMDDLQARADKVNTTRPKGQAEKLTGVSREIWSKSPEEWQTDLDGATVKLKAAKAARSALPDGDAGFKGADKAVRTAQDEVNRINAMRKMSMQDPVDIPPEVLPEDSSPTAAVADDAVPSEGDPTGPSFDEMAKFNKENVKAVRAEFHNQIQEQFASGLTAGQIVPDVNVPGGAKVDLGEVLKARDYTAWDPVSGMEVKGANVTPDTPVLPNQVFDEVSRYSKYNALDKANSKLLRAYDSATGKWKHTVLALSPRWHVGNVAGNVAMAMAAGLGPVDIIKYGMQAKKMIASGEIPAELLASGFHFSEEAMSSALTAGPVKGMQKLRHPIQASYQMNQFVDDMNRSMIYLEKKNSGISDRAAIDGALKAAGDFSRMTPFERNVIRRVVPFYAWQKHITKLVFRLPLEDPTRVAWTLHLAEMGERLAPDEGAEGFNENSIGIGGQRLSLNPLNPFASAFGMGGGKDNATRSMNPLIGAALAGVTGASTKRGLEGVTMPERDFGDAPKPLIGNLPQFGKYLMQQIPTTRQTMDMAEGSVQSRFDTGQPMPTQYPDDAQGREQQLLKFFGVDIRKDLKGETSKKVTEKKPGPKGGSKYSLK